MQEDDQRLAKSTLFCTECGHQSPADGDWRRIRSGRRVHYRCPDCNAEITVRPAPSAGFAPLSPYEFWNTWTNSVQAWWNSVLHP